MDELDRDSLVGRWTRHHSLRIPYRKWWGGRGRYEPDFLVELVDGAKELREVKGEHLFADANTARKLRAGDEFCRNRGMVFKVITKSAVDPAIWSPTSEVRVEEPPATPRPKLAEDAYRESNAGCAGVLVLGVAVLCVLLLLALRLVAPQPLLQ